jgi:hypothetical protein
LSPLNEEVQATLVGRKNTVDVIRTVAAHRPRVVTSMTRMVDLRRVGRRQGFETKIDTPSGLFIAVIQARKGDWAGQHFLLGYNAPGTVRCPGLTHDLDYEANRVTLTVPRRCIGTPNWVRLSLQNGLDVERGGAYLDNPHNDRAFASRRGTIRLYHG